MNRQPHPVIETDEQLYKAIERLGEIAKAAYTVAVRTVNFSESKDRLKPECQKEYSDEMTKLIDCILTETNGVSMVSILSRLAVNMAAVAQQKHTHGISLTFSKVNKLIHLKLHYAAGAQDFSDYTLDAAQAKQLRDALDKAVRSIEPINLVIPGGGLLQ